VKINEGAVGRTCSIHGRYEKCFQKFGQQIQMEEVTCMAKVYVTEYY